MAAPGRGGGAAADADEDSSENDALSQAVEAELAALEADLVEAAEEAPAEEPDGVPPSGLPPVLPDLSHLQPGEECMPEPAAVDTTFDGPLVLPLNGARPGTYHYELSRFLMLFVERHRVEGRIANLEAVLKLSSDHLGTPASAEEMF